MWALDRGAFPRYITLRTLTVICLFVAISTGLAAPTIYGGERSTRGHLLWSRDVRTCKRCKEKKPLDGFYEHSGMKDGYRLECKKCFIADASERRRNASEEAKERKRKKNREYYATHKTVAKVASEAWRKRNRKRHNRKNRVRRAENLDKARMAELKSNLKKYGLTPRDYREMLKAQGGTCAICKKTETFRHLGGRIRRLCVDHSHSTGRVRGLLCNNCNKLIASANDDVVVLAAAIDFLQRNGGEIV